MGTRNSSDGDLRARRIKRLDELVDLGEYQKQEQRSITDHGTNGSVSLYCNLTDLAKTVPGFDVQQRVAVTVYEDGVVITSPEDAPEVDTE